MDKEDKYGILMDNERNMVLYSLLGLLLAYIGINLPLKSIWVFPVILAEIVAVLTIAHGVLRYLERREKVIEDELKADEQHW